MCEAEGRDRQDQRGRDGQSMGSGLFERRAGEKKKKRNRERPPRAPGKSGLSAGAEPTVPRADGVKIFIKI